MTDRNVVGPAGQIEVQLVGLDGEQCGPGGGLGAGQTRHQPILPDHAALRRALEPLLEADTERVIRIPAVGRDRGVPGERQSAIDAGRHEPVRSRSVG